MIDQIIKFINTPLPQDWDSWTLEQRRWFWNNKDVIGEFHRQKVCALEIWQELYNRDVSEFTPAYAKEINAAIKKIPYWISKSSINAGSIYGRCRGFIWDGVSELADKIKVPNTE